MKKITITISLILLALITSLVIFLLFDYEQHKQIAAVHKAKSDTIVLFHDKIPLPNIDISNWQVYTNKEYGFEVKYPKDWVYKESYFKSEDMWDKFEFTPQECVGDLNNISTCDNIAKIAVSKNPILLDWKKDKIDNNCEIINAPTFMFTHQLDVIACHVDAVGQKRKIYYLSNNDSVFSLEAEYYVGDDNLYDLRFIEKTILKTLRFTN